MDKKIIIKICIAASILLILAILLISNHQEMSFYQIDDYIEEGNDKFEAQEFDNAKIKYIGALNIDSSSTGALYNMANADYRNEKHKKADSTLSKAAKACKKEATSEEEKELISKIFHNKGNAGMKQIPSIGEFVGDSAALSNQIDSAQDSVDAKKLEEVKKNLLALTKQARSKELPEWLKQVNKSINDYKEALRHDPKNDSTRFNLAYAQHYKKLLEEEISKSSQSQQNQQQDQQQKQDQEQEQKQEEQKPEEQKKEEEQQQNPNQMSKENAEQILKALEQEEKEKMKKRKAQSQESSSFNIEKDW
jgi:hypothetical protein